MKKGDLVRPKASKFGDWNSPQGFRSTTETEREQWRQQLRSDIDAGLTEWHDSAGEPRLAPRTRWIDLNIDDSYLVLRARAHARVGWGNGVPKCVYLACPKTGEKFYMHRDEVEVVSER
ncbi:MAG: hypothetical protein ACXABN_16230 [Candidatus Thorarchaeota archaeon]|jgi:hypothetical protein